MFLVTPMLPEHPRLLAIQEAQAFARFLVAERDYCEALAKAGPAYSAFVDGEVVACSGVVERHAGVWQAWALVSQAAGSHMLQITRATLAFLASFNANRIETAVDAKHDAGHRWAAILGFEREALMRKWMPDGGDAVLYARVK